MNVPKFLRKFIIVTTVLALMFSTALLVWVLYMRADPSRAQQLQPTYTRVTLAIRAYADDIGGFPERIQDIPDSAFGPAGRPLLPDSTAVRIVDADSYGNLLDGEPRDALDGHFGYYRIDNVKAILFEYTGGMARLRYLDR